MNLEIYGGVIAWHSKQNNNSKQPLKSCTYKEKSWLGIALTRILELAKNF